MADLGSTTQKAAAGSDQFLARDNTSGEVYRVPAASAVLGAPWAGAGVSARVLELFVWEAFRSLQVATWEDSEEPRLPATGTVTWPFDAAAGAYTTVSIDPDWRVADEFTITHTPSGLTVTVVLAVDASTGEITVTSVTAA